jgi:hypothetical protein
LQQAEQVDGRLDNDGANDFVMYLNAQYISGHLVLKLWQICAEVIAGLYSKTNYFDNFTADNHTSSEMIFTYKSDGVKTQIRLQLLLSMDR